MNEKNIIYFIRLSLNKKEDNTARDNKSEKIRILLNMRRTLKFLASMLADMILQVRIFLFYKQSD